MRKNRKKSPNPTPPLHDPSVPQELSSTNCFQGEHLNDLLQKLSREIELAKQSRRGLPEKIWIKQQFSIGVNDVTRVLERMPRGETGNSANEDSVICGGRQAPSIQLQAVLLAADCSPRWLTKHIPILASSRRVPVIFVKDHKAASLRLGELVKLKTAMAIGVKARGSRINEAIDEVLQDTGLESSDALKT